MGRRIYTTLYQDFPSLVFEWDYSKNHNLDPRSVHPKSKEYAWWKCRNCEYEWKTQIVSRTSTGAGCPKCARKVVAQKVHEAHLSKKGSLAQSRVRFLDEWDYEKNTTISPNEITYGSETKVWWKCRNGHSWYASPNGRAHSGCPICSSERHTSFPEQALFFFLSQYFHAENRYILNRRELDIYIPEISIGIEYDGEYYHRSKEAHEREAKKDSFFLSNGISVIRIKEAEYTSFQLENSVIYYVPKSDFSSLDNVITELLRFLGVEQPNTVDVKENEALILQRFLILEKENSLLNRYPELALEWDVKQNLDITPDKVNSTSRYKASWICKNGHKWKAAVYSRVAGNGCPLCSGKTLAPGENDLESQNPKLALEWNFEKNKDLRPHQITVNNGKKVWWRCSQCGFEWEATVAHRNNGRGCPECAKRISTEKFCKTQIAKVGCLADVHPELISEWDCSKNIDVSPYTVSPRSGRKVWWKCQSCGYEWEALISNRAKGVGCPECAKKRRITTQMHNSLLTKKSLLETHPEIAAEWNYELNAPLTPEMITPGSSRKVAWICCKCGNVWDAYVCNRTRKNQGCPSCRKQRRNC